ncbi:glycosyltransferase [Viridibacillus arvi]|uniref:glycosyltransferase n=1 Tax=Viridibacillus arvi TaxID=263475 RepID=UPI0034CDDE24
MTILNPNYNFLKEDYGNASLANHVITTEKKKSVFAYGAFPTLLLTPTAAFASDNTFGNVYHAVMNMFDSAVVLVIIFSGASWMLGHRSKSIELLIGAACGYLLARHAIDIRDFLKSI